MDKKYEFRVLKSSDIFLMIKLLNKIGLKQIKEHLDPENLGKIATAFSKGKKVDNEIIYSIGVSVAMDVVTIILENLPTCRNEIYDLLTAVSNLKRKEIEDLPIPDFTQMIIDFVQKEEFKDFIQVVSKFTK